MSPEHYKDPATNIYQELKELAVHHPIVSDSDVDLDDFIVNFGERYLYVYTITIREDETISLDGTLYDSKTETATFLDSQKDLLIPFISMKVEADLEVRKMHDQEDSAAGPTGLDLLRRMIHGDKVDKTPEKELQDNLDSMEDISSGALSEAADYAIRVSPSGNCTMVNLSIEGYRDNEYYSDWAFQSPSGKALARSLNERRQAFVANMDRSRAVEELTEDEQTSLLNAISSWVNTHQQ